METKRSSSTGHDMAIPIAIIGLAFEFPQEATSVESFWQMICEGRSASTEFPPDRLNINAFYHPDENRPSSIPLRGGHFVKEGLGAFDAPFFSITPGEAACMDPQHRRMLETAYHALEDAGVPIDKCSGSNTSVYTGCFTNDYLSILQQDYDAEQRHAAMGIAPSMLANRLSWFFDFKGTSMNLDSACSSSLIALHLACQDLRAGGSEMAIVGGANLVYHPNFMKIMSDFNFLSRDSRCWSFDQKANGYARGEGTAVIVAKRLDHALRDGDTIRAVIRNTGSNQDGRTPGITQPSQAAQIDLIQQTYRQAGIDMEPTRFFEAHATGTPVGDPVEGNAIGAAFRGYRSVDDPLYVGAVKANIGHLEGCSGLAGIIKATLVIERGIIPPIAGFESLNDQIDAESLHLHVNSFGFGGTNAVAILDDAYNYLKLNNLRGFHRTRSSASLNGYSGSPSGQLHSPVILDNGILDDTGATNGVDNWAANGVNGTVDARKRKRVTNGAEPDHAKKVVTSNRLIATNKAGPHTGAAHANFIGANGKTLHGSASPTAETSLSSLLVWSAPDQQGAQSLSDAYRRYIGGQTPRIDDLAYTLAVRRSHFSWRSFAVVDSGNGACIEDVTPSGPVKATSGNGRVAFVFTGQGAQYLGMGCQLLSFPVFRGSLAKSDNGLRQLGCSWSLLEIMAGRSTLDVDRPEYSQPLTTCLQLALVDLLRSLDIMPSLVLGHSSGEIAAAYATGALSQFSAIKVAHYRGQLSSRLAGQMEGLTMMAVGLSKEHVLPYLDQLNEADGVLNVAVGCVNSPKSVTLTGDTAQLSKLEGWLEENGIFARRLRVPIAYHSRFMNAIADDYSMAIAGLEWGQSSGFVPMISSVTGDFVTAAMLSSADYWVRNLTSTVEFEAAFSKLLAQANRKPRKQLGKNIDAAGHVAITHVLEIGPHSALQGPIRENVQGFAGTKKPGYITSLVRNQDACIALLNAVGALYCSGYPVNLLRANGLDNSHRPAPADMPRYPFNHSHSYWRESQLSRNFRFRDKARHDLLGTRSLDWNPLMAQWRNVMRLTELPWLQDHTIGGDIVFPAAGMIVMAIEGLRDLFGDSASLRGIHLQNATFSHAISFPRGADSIETQLTLSRQSQSSDFSAWSQFRLFVLENGSYMECCSGLIRAVVDNQDRDHVVSSGPWTATGTPEDWVTCINQACQGPERDPYDMPAGTTVRYGPVFQNLENMRLGARGEAVAQVNTETSRLNTAGAAEPSFVIHPATLDGLAQPLLQALLAQQRDDLPTMVPVRVASIWIDCNSNALHEGKINVAASCSFRGYRGGSADVVATATDPSKPLIFLDGLETTFISSTALVAKQRQAANPRFLCTKLIWKPDLETMTHEQVLLHCTRDRPKQAADAVRSYQSLMVAILCFVRETIAFMDKHTDLKVPRHLEAYISWMRYQQERLRNGESPVTQQSVQQILDDSEAQERLISQVENSGVDGFFFMQVGRHLTKMLRGDIDPLAFMFHDGLADRYYEKMLANDHHAYPASEYIDLLCFKTPSMNILEVGAGTGGQTMRLLETMSSDGVRKWARYDYTDISPSFFNQARNKFHEHLDQMNFRVCDISKDPASQTFEASTYDLVVASHVLHATDDLDLSLRNIRKLLKPDGKLLLFETTRPEAIQVGFAFGLLKGWWSPLDHEQRSPHSPCLTVAQWDERLRRTGFSGVDVEIPGQEEPLCRDSSIIISSATTPATGMAKAPPQISLVVDNQAEAQRTVAQLLETRLIECLGASCETSTLAELAEADIPESSVVIFLKEIDAIFLDGISKIEYRDLQSILVRAKDVIWTTRADPADGTEPRHHLADGLGRTLMSEDSSRKFVSICLDRHDRGAEQVAKVICELAERVIEQPVESVENNYVAAGDTLQICRIAENIDMDTRVARVIMPRQKLECQLETGTLVKLHLASPGQLDTLEWMENDDVEGRDEESLGQDEVVVQVRAIGLTFRDRLVASGQLNEPILGTECAGIVQAAAENSSFQAGDRVCLLATSTARSVVRVKASAVAAIPQQMSFAEAASMPSALWLAYRALVDVARVEVGETVLVHRASSCVGQMAVQLAQRLGAHVLVTTMSASSGALLRDHFMIPEADIFYTDDGSALRKIYRSTQEAGVDVVIGSLAEDSHGGSHDFSACLAPLGRLVDISLLKASRSAPATSGHRESVNISRASIRMVDILQKKPLIAHRTFQRAAKIAFEQHLRPPQPLHTFGASEVEAAFRHLSTAEAVGKRVIEMNPDMTIMANVKTKARCTFRSDATYVIAGGLGGLGRSFARWMVSRGARSLILLSRSGVSSSAARALVAELTSQGVCVATPAVDISNLERLKQEIEMLTDMMPPVRGCIQATVALKDNLFPNMSYGDWVVGTSSKATGSWNLHAALPSGLDFFVLLASLNGIVGGRAQANYAAGNTFKDALAHHRISLGEKAISIDLGLMVAEGVVAENEQLLASMRRIGHLMDISQGELLALLDYYCDPTLPLLPQDQAQILVGLETPAAVLVKGIDLHHAIHRPLFRQLFRMRSGTGSAEPGDDNNYNNHNAGAQSSGSERDRTGALRRATSDDQAGELVTQWFAAKIAQVLGLDEADVDAEKPVHTFGIDSLVAIDLKNWFAREIGAEVQVFVLLGNTPLGQVAREAAARSTYRAGVAARE